MSTVPSDVSPSVRSVLDSAPRAIVATTPDGTIQLWNKAAERLYGWHEDEVVGIGVTDLLVPRALAREAHDILPRVGSGGRWSGEFFVLRKGGGTVRVLVSLWPLTEPDGTVVGVVGESEEVTAEQLLDAELRARGESLVLGLQDGNLGSWYWDTTTGSVTWDTSLEALHGLDPGGFAGSFDDWLALVHPDDRDATRDTLHRLHDATDSCQIEHRVCWSDGSEHWLLARGQVIRDEDGAVVAGFAGPLTEPRLVAQQGPLLEAERGARMAAEGASSRLAGLQAVTAALSRALDPAEVADAVFGHGLAHLGGNTASLCVVAPGGTTVDIVHEIGYTQDVKEQWRSFPLDAALPASDAIRTGELVLLRSMQERDELYPVFVGTPMVGSQAYAVVPLPDEDGTAFGALVVGFDQPREFDAGERSLLMALGSLCAGSLRRARLFEVTRAAMEAEQEARLAAEKTQDRLAFMAEASSTLASFLDYELTLSQVVDLAVPRLADWCAVHLVRDDGRIRPLAVAHVDPGRLALVRDLLDRYPPDPDAESGLGAVVRTGRPEIHRRITEELVTATMADPEQRDLINRVGLGATAVFPLRARGRVLGAISLATDKGATFSEDSLSLAQELAVRSGVAIDNALLFDDRSRIARRLQACLLPARLPVMPGLEVGARYLAAGEGVQVGGDLYDVFPVDRSAVGRRGRRRTGKGRGGGRPDRPHPEHHPVRSHPRAGAERHPGPRQRGAATRRRRRAVGGAGQRARRLGAERAPVLHGRSGRGGAHARRGGGHHLDRRPPAPAARPRRRLDRGGRQDRQPARRRRRPRPARRRRGPGSRRRPRVLHRRDRRTARGQAVLRRGRRGHRGALGPGNVGTGHRRRHRGGSSRLRGRRAARRHGGRGPARALYRRDRRRVTAMAGVGSESRTSFPCVPASAGKARRFVRSVLAELGSSELCGMAELLVSELVTNAILHAGTDLEVVVRVMPGRVSVEVHDRGPGAATRRHYSATSGTGRGLVLVDELARDWGTVVTADGKFVWFDLAIPNGAEHADASPAVTG